MRRVVRTLLLGCAVLLVACEESRDLIITNGCDTALDTRWALRTLDLEEFFDTEEALDDWGRLVLEPGGSRTISITDRYGFVELYDDDFALRDRIEFSYDVPSVSIQGAGCP